MQGEQLLGAVLSSMHAKLSLHERSSTCPFVPAALVVWQLAMERLLQGWPELALFSMCHVI
jgi:hypothetical protein